MLNILLAKKYAAAMFELAQEENKLAQSDEQLTQIGRLFDECVGLKAFMDNPQVAIQAKKELMKKILQQENYLCNIYVDNDYECILPIEKFIEIGMPTDWGNDA